MATEKLTPFTKERFEALKKAYEDAGYKILNKWRKGTTVLKLGDIILSQVQDPGS